MRNFRCLFSALLLAGLSSFSALAAAAEGGPLQIQDYQGVPYVTGGVGEEERDYLKTISKNFNLKLMFAATTGNYLSDVQVEIRDARNQTVLDAVSNGPFLYADLPAGSYTVAVSGPGQVAKRSVKLSRGRQVQLNFFWK
jgi:hypothetical protein